VIQVAHHGGANAYFYRCLLAAVQLLFSSRPVEAKVRDVKSLIGSVVGVPAAAVGDVRLNFDRKAWTVSKHAVAAP
jgi:hypothetical protein